MNNPLIKLDKKDLLIMQQLELNSRASYKEIGKKVGLSGEIVEYRIARMLSQDLISTMFAEPNLSKLGLKTYRVYLKMENMNEKDAENFFAYISTHPKAQWYAEFEGEWDYTIRYAMENETQLKEEIDNLISKFGKFIKAKDILITSYQSYLPITYFTNGERLTRTLKLTTTDKIEIDKTDREIISMLMENARVKSVEIAKKIKTSPDTVNYRIRKLVKEGVIAFFTTWFDRRKLGYEYYKVLIWFQYATSLDEKRLISYCEQNRNVVFINRVLGNWDLEVDFDARNSKEIHDVVKDLKIKFSNIIRDHTTLTILRDGIINPLRSDY